MDWITLLRMPMTVLLILAAVCLLMTLMHLLACRHHLRHGRRAAAALRGLGILVFLALALLFGASGCALRGYRLLADETPVVDIESHILSPQRWLLTLRWPDGSTRQVPLDGDGWQVDAVVLKWKLPGLLAGLPPLYRLDRLSGRYDDVAQETTAPRTAVGFDSAGDFDLLNLRRHYADWLPEVDTVYGSSVFLPLVDEGHYTVSLMRSGALVARPDDPTQQKIGQPFGS